MIICYRSMMEIRNRGRTRCLTVALNMIMDGQSVGGTNSGLGQGEGEGEGDGEGGEGEGEGQGMGEGTGEGGEGEGSLTRNGGISFHKLPPAKLPRKN